VGDAEGDSGPAKTPQPAGEVGRGVSWRDAAELIAAGDPDRQNKLIDQWRKSSDPKPPRPIGKCPRHPQRNLYEPAEILRFLKSLEGERVVADFRLKAGFSRVSRLPRPA